MLQVRHHRRSAAGSGRPRCETRRGLGWRCDSWSLEEPTEEDEKDRDNYKSMVGFESQVEKLFQEEAVAGWMEEVTDEEARRRHGERVCIGSLAVKDEKTKIRVVHDGSHGVHVNHRIKTRDQVRMPRAASWRPC